MSTRHKIPRLADHAGRLFRRSSFLAPTDDGTRISTFFGPGQRPDAVDRYTPPSDWPAAGTLLRTPQVVWLSGLTRTLFYQFPYEAGSNPPPVQYAPLAERVVMTTNPVFATGEGFSAPGVGPNWYFESVANQDLIDYREIQELLATVADRLAALRPNRTWVHQVDWLTWNPAGNTNADPFPAYDGPGPTAENFSLRYLGSSAGTYHLWTPVDTASPFFGTDFLHVYMGIPFVRLGGRGGYYTTDGVGNPLRNSYYTAARDGIAANAAKFDRYAVRAYGNDQTWETYPLWPGTGDVVAGDAVGTWNQSVVQINADNANLSVNGNAYLESSCRDASDNAPDADIQYMGVRNGLGADDIVQMIAEHYGFDPDTGKDVG